MRLQLSWFKHVTLNHGTAGSSPARRTMGWTIKAQVHKTSKRREHRRNEQGSGFFYRSQSDLKQETRLNLKCSTKCPRSSDGIEHRISNPLARGSSPFGDTIYGFSSMERVSGYEPLDRGSTPLIRTRRAQLNARALDFKSKDVGLTPTAPNTAKGICYYG